MKRQRKLTFIVTMLAVIGLMATAGVSSQTGDATAIPQETLDAAVAQLFQQTADAVMNQTATAVADMSGTATAQGLAAPTQTVEALFQQAMTATAQTIIPSYDTYDVIDVQEFELRAGPANTGAHLSPDGTRFAHIDGFTVCIYALDDDGVWAEDGCYTDDSRENRISDAEEIRWSPDNRWLALPTFREAFVMFRDPDLRVMNSETGEIIRLTDDGVDGGPLDDDFAGLYDIGAQWIDEDTLVFARYSPDFPEGGGIPFGQPHLMRIDVPDGEPEEIADLPSTVTLSVYVLDVSDDGSRIAYSVDHRDNEPGQGIWMMNLDDLDPVPVLPLTVEDGLPMNLEISATNQYLTLIMPAASRSGMTNVKALDIANREIIDIDPDRTVVGAAWSPRGTGLAYLVRNNAEPEENGLYITSEPGTPGRLVLQGDYFTGTCCGRMPMTWAENDTILLARIPGEGVLLVKVGMSS